MTPGDLPGSVPRGRLQFVAEGLLAEAQLAHPELLGLDVHVWQGERLLCRSGRGDLRPRAEVVVDPRGHLMMLAVPPGTRREVGETLHRLADALAEGMREPAPRRRTPAVE